MTGQRRFSYLGWTAGAGSLAVTGTVCYLPVECDTMTARHRRWSWKVKCAALLVSLVVTGLLVVAADRVIGLLVPSPVEIIFSARTRYHYATPEFNFTALTNAYGIRDRELARIRAPGPRILAIGDSFTYGWGVDVEDAWPRQLERRLKEAGIPGEVLNLGCPGASPYTYARIAERAIPVLMPDLVIVAVLQGEDLAQLQVRTEPRLAGDGRSSQGFAVRNLIPNLNRLRRTHRAVLDKNDGPLAKEWSEQARGIVAKLTPVQRSRYEAMAPPIREAFLNGALNPFLVFHAIREPDRFRRTLDPTRPETRALLEDLAAQLGRIRRAAACPSRLLVASVPYPVYIWRTGLENHRKMGYALEEELLATDDADRVTRIACREASIPFCEATALFRSRAGTTALFFALDGHFNGAGHALFAEVLAPAVAGALRRPDGACAGAAPR